MADQLRVGMRVIIPDFTHDPRMPLMTGMDADRRIVIGQWATITHVISENPCAGWEDWRVSIDIGMRSNLWPIWLFREQSLKDLVDRYRNPTRAGR